MAWTTPTSVSAGDAITASLYNTYVGDNLKAVSPSGPDWISYTPVIGNGWTLGTGTLTGKYIRYGDLIGVIVEFTVGNGTKGAGIPTFTLPVNVSSLALSFATAYLSDIGVDDWMGQAIVNQAGLGNVLGFQYMAIDGAYLKPRAVSNTAPFTWGTGDTMRTSPVFYKAD